jgi:predicted MPP superfamily phosphohydrolase
MAVVRVLHVSDLHAGAGPEADQQEIVDAMLADAQSFARVKEFDLALFSGDLTFSGAVAEYQMASAILLNPLERRLRLSRDRIMLVPGNHDVHWDDIDDWDEDALSARLTGRERVNELLTNPDKLTRACGRLARFEQFYSDYFREHPPRYHEPLVRVRRVTLDDTVVGIAGLNSAWRSAKADDAGRLLLGDHQVRMALSAIENCDVRLVAVHHPLNWLDPDDARQVRTLLEGGSALVFSGHEHDANPTAEQTLRGEAIYSRAGCLYEAHQFDYPNTYNVVDIDTRAGVIDVHVRQWSTQRRRFDKATKLVADGRRRYSMPHAHQAVESTRPIVGDDGAPASAYLASPTGRVAFLRAVSGLALVRQTCLQTASRKATPMARGTAQHSTAQQILDLLDEGESAHPVTLRMLTELTTWFIARLHSFTEPAGLAPESMAEFRQMLSVLFGDTLRVLKATSIHSNHRELRSYKGYWENPELGEFFSRCNQDFLGRPNTKLQRVYACDSVADAVAEAWFANAVNTQVRDGASVKIVQINPASLGSYEDFGIYQHESAAAGCCSYLLLAPVDMNRDSDELHTRLTPDAVTVQNYGRKFADMWAESDEELEIIESPPLATAAAQDLDVYGSGTIHDLFEGRVILRKMRRLDTDTPLLSPGAEFVRKHEPKYATALAEHIRNEFPDVARVLYVGDTYKNDGAVIRNLQHCGVDVSGFICEPQLELDRLWFKSVLYSSRWTDVIGLVAERADYIGPETLAIFDIDQTLWAPKGVGEAEAALTHARTAAIEALIDAYLHDTDGETAVAVNAKARVAPLYDELRHVDYVRTLTLDNEDHKAALCVFLSLNVMRDPDGGRGDFETDVAYFTRVSEMGAAEFLTYVRETYLPTLIRPAASPHENITRFMAQTLGVVELNQFSHFGETHGVVVPAVRDAVVSIVRAIGDGSPVAYEAFRQRELDESLLRASGELPIEESLVINKSTWDLACWLKDRGATLLALSDRPDEATRGAERSLLKSEMTIYGRPIGEYLPSAPQT